MTVVTSPGKLILCGEHAVVYDRPAIALPLTQICAQVHVVDSPYGSGIMFDAPNLQRHWTLAEEPEDPASALVVHLLEHVGIARNGKTPDLHITITSDIPVAGGLGSGAAVATALLRAISTHLDCTLSREDVSKLVYESERHFHGTPSGIDNTVIAYEQPIWFCRSSAYSPWRTIPTQSMSASAEPHIQPIVIAGPLTLLIGDTGIRSETRLPVDAVRQRRERQILHYEALFDAIGAVVTRIRAALAEGNLAALGLLLNNNHLLLQQMGVSSTELDQLVDAARESGALGAKLSGGGWGGVMLALVELPQVKQVSKALLAAGAVQVYQTQIAPTTKS
ncbi:MAG: mevalonate kinase [Chloroflexi bacterium AL-W]|nr:mevalonate kinase [Chloroflexi bacterium AL-N1]NOK71552.1 mevalonate kinase [Chloroflexi bacterium AL-N10]NOK78898.1 mevalonate kinase [Chloroflexi bacterium AL-N5]NOK86374.1 mevalonate kinase [Chloroflexi bacterium AL-W]NOK93343.1 mevalonate kinase [Chloroflexi bacterium AL-N15]